MLVHHCTPPESTCEALYQTHCPPVLGTNTYFIQLGLPGRKLACKAQAVGQEPDHRGKCEQAEERLPLSLESFQAQGLFGQPTKVTSQCHLLLACAGRAVLVIGLSVYDDCTDLPGAVFMCLFFPIYSVPCQLKLPARAISLVS